MARKHAKGELPTVDWPGASGRRYHYWVYRLPARFEPGQTGNFIFARLDGRRWVPLYIGQGDLHAAATAPPARACLEAAGATHLHANQGGHTQVRRDEARDLLRAHPEALQPHGCTPAGSRP
jgi:hypothetical protein